mmetsp:Transcript_42063/g.100249  ORF Transcript_42063/g.100249 Transcript_42063/m.100249 type:complete len:309 (-) Transcript_42063:391-1317(-)
MAKRDLDAVRLHNSQRCEHGSKCRPDIRAEGHWQHLGDGQDSNANQRRQRRGRHGTGLHDQGQGNTQQHGQIVVHLGTLHDHPLCLAHNQAVQQPHHDVQRHAHHDQSNCQPKDTARHVTDILQEALANETRTFDLSRVVVAGIKVASVRTAIVREGPTGLQSLIALLRHLLPSFAHTLGHTVVSAAVCGTAETRRDGMLQWRTEGKSLHNILVLAEERLGQGTHNRLGGRGKGQVGGIIAQDGVSQALGNPEKESALARNGRDDNFNRQQSQNTQHVEHVVDCCTGERSLELNAVSHMSHGNDGIGH